MIKINVIKNILSYIRKYLLNIIKLVLVILSVLYFKFFIKDIINDEKLILALKDTDDYITMYRITNGKGDNY